MLDSQKEEAMSKLNHFAKEIYKVDLENPENYEWIYDDENG